MTRPILPILPKPIFLFLTLESSDPCLGSLASLTLCTTHFYKNGTHVATRFLIQLQYICENVSGLQLNDIPSNMTAMRSHREGRAGGRSPYCTASRPILWVDAGTPSYSHGMSQSAFARCSRRVNLARIVIVATTTRFTATFGCQWALATMCYI